MACSPAGFAASLKGAGVKPKGTLVIAAADGSVIEGTGDLDGSDGAKVAVTIFSMLQDAAGFVGTTSDATAESSGDTKCVQKLSVVFGSFEYGVTLDTEHIYVAKKMIAK